MIFEAKIAIAYIEVKFLINTSLKITAIKTKMSYDLFFCQIIKSNLPHLYPRIKTISK